MKNINGTDADTPVIGLQLREYAGCSVQGTFELDLPDPAEHVGMEAKLQFAGEVQNHVDPNRLLAMYGKIFSERCAESAWINEFHNWQVAIQFGQRIWYFHVDRLPPKVML